MDMDDNELNLGKNKLVEGMESQKDVLNGEKEDEDESKSLLPSKRGGLLKKPVNPKLKVQWNDRNGDKLAEILEFQPSETSDSEEEESDSWTRLLMAVYSRTISTNSRDWRQLEGHAMEAGSHSHCAYCSEIEDLKVTLQLQVCDLLLARV
nr:uncharacterized protein LOC111401535 isoform X1 [Ipomoea batatas]